MIDHRELLRSLRLRPGMYLGTSELPYERLVTYVLGLDQGSAALDGFREFLVLKVGTGDNLTWPGLVGLLGGSMDEDARVALLFDLLDEFLAEVQSAGRLAIYREYFAWLRAQPWHDVDLERFHGSPPLDLINVDDTAGLLGISRFEVFDLVARGELRPLRSGAEIFFRRGEVQRPQP
ncbi:hypothetical protein Lesp02_15860 [Lentzea sp. NBRC 105346]|uniref:helix-turn-helix domain-containing protein n=1 Tax=Lentzea sp. NBRC 105346 TaxID=3032205 RepID=UPI0024A205B4|nr:helix-turn-helix domain-containing protein [Lentzea sp. NBRC 105346]GLZ29396.1 hypothetical protein Lesp02_15860 [Lentzea sp. NBRC 105346]